MVSITYLVVLTVSNQVIQKTVRDSLIETVTHNVDEIEFYKSMADVTPGSDVDHFIVYRGGFLEIDDDFLDEVNSVYTGLLLRRMAHCSTAKTPSPGPYRTWNSWTGKYSRKR